MDKIITGIIAAVVAVIVVISAGVFTKPADQTNTPPLGSVTGPDSQFQTETHNGISFAFNRIGMIASTTSCVIKSPAATSTLLFASAVVKGNQTAETINITTGTAMQASTTALSGNFSIAAGGQAAIYASTTNSEATRTFNPNTWLQVNIFGGGGVASSTGTCQATFENL